MTKKTPIPQIIEEDLKNAIARKSKKTLGVEFIDGEVYFDATTDKQKENNDHDLVYHDVLDYDPSKPRSDSISSLSSTSSEGLTDRSASFDSNESQSPKSVKALASAFEKKSPSPVKKLESPTKGISGQYAGKDIEQIRETIRKAVDPHTYQREDSGEIKKGHYGHQSGSKSRF